MDNHELQRIKKGILEQKENLTSWLSECEKDERTIRVGPAGEEAIHEHLCTLDEALQKADDNTLGLCDVCHDYIESSRLEMDYTACICLEHLTGEERSILENELELSQKVQKALLPQAVPVIKSLEMAAFSQPAHLVGGDYFDFLRLKNGAHAIVIADVMGKGMPASLLMASLQASLRIIAPENLEPSEVVTRLNHLFCHNIQLTKFVSLVFARYDEISRVLTYCNAGHNPPLLHRTNGMIETLRPTGAAIGLAEQSLFSQAEVSLHTGDSILMYTDGVVESVNSKKEEFGQERLENFLRDSAKLSSRQVIASLRETIVNFRGSPTPTDDTTIIAMRVTK